MREVQANFNDLITLDVSPLALLLIADGFQCLVDDRDLPEDDKQFLLELIDMIDRVHGLPRNEDIRGEVCLYVRPKCGNPRN